MFISDPNIQSLKSEQRDRARQRLKLIANKDQKSFLITENIRSFLFSYTQKRSRMVCAIFMGLPTEPNLRELISHPVVQPELATVFWALPRISGEDLKFYVPDLAEASTASAAATHATSRLSAILVPNEFGIDEPQVEKSQEVTISQIDVVFVPGLAFDKNMNRLGRGRAYYDRFLKEFTGLKVGVLFQDQLITEKIIVQSHDIQMDWLITENCIYKTTEKKRTA